MDGPARRIINVLLDKGELMQQGRFWLTYPTVDDLKAGRTRAKREAPLTKQEMSQAIHHRSYGWGGRCLHDTECENWKACVTRIARSRRE